jgi:Phage Mu protein F like protein
MDRLEQDELWRTFHRFQKSREKAYGPKINKALKSQVNQFLDGINNSLTYTQALDKVTSQTMYEVLKPLYLDAGVTYGAKHLAYLKRQKARMPIGFNALMVELLNQYFNIDLLNTVEEITGYTKELIRNIFLKAIPLGLSISEITEQLQSVNFTYQRSRLIARTETVIAANTGAMLAAQTTGLKLNKVWIAARDNRTRRRPRDKYDHLHMDGVTIPKEQPFTVTGELMMQPGDTKMGAKAGNICNCRCTIGFVPIRNKDGRLAKL